MSNIVRVSITPHIEGVGDYLAINLQIERRFFQLEQSDFPLSNIGVREIKDMKKDAIRIAKALSITEIDTCDADALLVEVKKETKKKPRNMKIILAVAKKPFSKPVRTKDR